MGTKLVVFFELLGVHFRIGVLRSFVMMNVSGTECRMERLLTESCKMFGFCPDKDPIEIRTCRSECGSKTLVILILCLVGRGWGLRAGTPPGSWESSPSLWRSTSGRTDAKMLHYKSKISRQIIAISPRTSSVYVVEKNISRNHRIQLLRLDSYLWNKDII